MEARTNDGHWFVRIENPDPSREVPGASREILKALERSGMEWDGEVVYQSRRDNAYRAALATLETRHMIYPCSCSRKEIADSATIRIDGPVYPGTCRKRNHSSDYRSARRIRTDNTTIEFSDALQGLVRQQLDRDIGDFVLQRADGVFTYQLAVVVDDAEQAITHVVRGEDLLNSTPRQIYLQQLLGYSTPFYLHLPIVVNAQGQKLSKQSCAETINASDPVPHLVTAMELLGQMPPPELFESDLASFWKWAMEHWRSELIPKKTGMIY